VASKSTYAFGVGTDLSGNVFTAGYTDGGLDGNALTGANDFFVTKYTSAGLRQWTKQMGAPQATTQAKAIAVHSSGRVYVVGETDRGIDFATQTGITDAFSCQYIGN
jgi:hypothetical protein